MRRVLTLTLPYPLPDPPAQRVIDVTPLRLRVVVLRAHVMHQTVLVIIFVAVRPLVVHPVHPCRDTVCLLCQVPMAVIPVHVLCILPDPVVRPLRELALRVQFRVRQAVPRRVRRIRHRHVQVRGGGAHARQPSRVAVAVLPAFLRPADAREVSCIVIAVLPVQLRQRQVLAL